jgi:hypothetical protein
MPGSIINGYGIMKSARVTLLCCRRRAGRVQRLAAGDGHATSIIVLAPDSVWEAIGDSVLTALEPRIFTVRDERTFEVTQVSPQDPRWSELRRFRQVLAIGTAEDGWVQPALRRADAGPAHGVTQVRNVWARNQLVTAMVLPPGGGRRRALQRVPRASAMIDSTFRQGALQRMYQSRPDEALRDSLLQPPRASASCCRTYTVSSPGTPTVYLFQNSTQIGGDLVRSVLVTWREGLHEPSPEAALEWRAEVAVAEYRPAQATPRDRTEGQMLEVNGRPAAEVQGIWDGTDPTWPMSGPFITRIVSVRRRTAPTCWTGGSTRPAGRSTST